MKGSRHFEDAAARAMPSYAFLAPLVLPKDTSSTQMLSTGPCVSIGSSVLARLAFGWQFK